MRLCLIFSIPHTVSQTCFWMTLPLPFCVGGCRPGLYSESCLVSSQGTSAADSSSCGQRASLLPSAGSSGGLAQRPAWAARWALTPRVPEAAQLHSSIWGVDWPRRGSGLLWFSLLHLELPAAESPPGPKDRVGSGDSESLFISRGGRAPPFLLSGLLGSRLQCWRHREVESHAG